MSEHIRIIDNVRNNIGKVILGKNEVIDLLITSMICSGHVLLEDVPGVGKTTLAKALAKSIDCSFNRVQFTPDLLPADLTGVNIYDQKLNDFVFKKGPVFTNILLADEINRATPRTQSSLLECMEERQVTVDGQTYRLEKPFLVIATQNPIENYGTFPLPEAQLDRFFMKIKLGYPGRQEEQHILELFNGGSPLEQLTTVFDKDGIAQMQQSFTSIYVSKDISGYILDIIEATRNSDFIQLGASPRASIALYKGAQAYAYIQGRDYVKPDDVIYLAPYILSHRIILKGFGTYRKNDSVTAVKELVGKITVPMENV